MSLRRRSESEEGEEREEREEPDPEAIVGIHAAPSVFSVSSRFSDDSRFSANSLTGETFVPNFHSHN